MRTCNQLAGTEMNRGHFDAAKAWYERSHELAEQLNDKHHLAVVAQNVGILYLGRAEQASNPETRAASLRQAVTSIEESLAIKLEMQNQVGAASSYFQLGVLYHMLGELDQAEEHAQQALKIDESLNLPDVYKVYNLLADIARDRGDTKAAAHWQAKRDAKISELKRLRRGEGTDAQKDDRLDQLAEPILALAQAAYFARTNKAPLPPEAAEALAQLKDAPPPLVAVGTFFQAISEDKAPPPVPTGLPPKIAEILQALAEELEKVKS